jgi:hypothetical protein
MLRPLRHLRKLSISMFVPDAHHMLLRVLGETCPELRQLEVLEDVWLEHELSDAPLVPTFPRLEYLGIRALKVVAIREMR